MLKKVYIEVFLERTMKALNEKVLNVIYQMEQGGKEQARIIYDNAEFDVVPISDLNNAEITIEVTRKVSERK